MLIHGYGLHIAQMQNKANKGSRKYSFCFLFFFLFVKLIVSWEVHVCPHARVWVLKELSLQNQESSVCAGGSGSTVLLFIVAISLEMEISSLTHHHVLNTTACKIHLISARKYVPGYLLV